MSRIAKLLAVGLLLIGLIVAVAVSPASAQEPPPVLRNIVVEGNTGTDRSVIDRIIGLEPGDPLPLEEFDSAWDRLEDCGYFAFVDLDTEEHDDGTVTLLVSVEEEKSARFTPYLRYDRRHKYLLGASYIDKNLRGKGEVLDLLAIALYIQRTRATWTKPWFLGGSGLSLKLDALWEQGGFVWRPFNYGAWWATADLRQTIAGPLYVDLGGGYESFDQRDTYTGDEGGGEQTFEAGRRDTWLIRSRLGYDSRSNPFYPAKGIYATYSVAYRTGLDIEDQTTQEVDLRGFIPLPGRPILALHGYAKTVDRFQYTEYITRWGGPETVRGAPYAGREGDTAYIATIELRWPLFMMPVAVTGEQVGFGLHFFSDLGDAYYREHDTASLDRALVSFGGGLHLNLLTWQLRFEVAKERDHDTVFEFMDVFNF